MTNPDKETVDMDYDIGVIKSNSDARFYGSEASAITNVGPICLTNENVDLNEKEMTSVGWGARYSEWPEADADDSPDATASSCTTTEFGPSGSRFKQCDLKQIKTNGQKCTFPNIGKDFPVNYDQKLAFECMQIVNKIKRDIQNIPVLQMGDTLLSQFEQCNQFEIIRGSETKTCYNFGRFMEDGWCKVANAATDGEWGFCSTSCKRINDVSVFFLS